MFATRTFVVASLAAVFAQVTFAAECTRKYTVKEGDYCDKISAANNASTYQLGATNAGVINEACTNLQIDSTICLGNAEGDCQTTYVVQGGDSCGKIWENSRINATIFSFNNPQVNQDCSNIYIGEVLCVANEVLVPSAPAGPIHTGPPPEAPVVLANGVTTTVPPKTAPTPAPAPVAVQPEEDHDEDCEEIEVVVGETDEDLPFCDELE